MILRLDIERLRTLDEVRDFMAGSSPVDFRFVKRADAYGFMRRFLVRSRYVRLSRPDKGLVRRFLIKVTGFSRAQIARLIFQYRETGRIEDRRRGPKRPFSRRYTKADIGLLAEVDETLGGLCGAVTRRMMQRQYAVFGDVRFERLAGLSNSHLYRLRESTTYRRRRLVVVRTRSTQVRIGERRKPHPAGRPGFLRVDSVHQGDLDGEKGLYEINLVDEVTQYEFVAAVEGISERFLVPALEGSIEAFPFIIRGFHAALVNDFLRDVLAPFLNYHRPCHFPVETTDAKGRIRKTYPFDKVTTPYLKLKSLDGPALCLRPAVTFEQLDQQALALDDLAAASAVKEALIALFAEIRRREATVA